MVESRGQPWVNGVSTIARYGLAGLLIFSAMPKLYDPSRFLVIIYNYDILSEFAGLAVAVFVPILQVALGLCLLSGSALSGTFLTCALMFLTFAGAITSTVWRGLEVPCGCFRLEMGQTPASWMDVFLSVTLCVIAILLLAHHLSLVGRENVSDGLRNEAAERSS